MPTELSGLVAIVENGSVVTTKDLGPKPVAVKPGVVFPIDEDKPPLGANEVYDGTYTYTINDTFVTRHWVKKTLSPSSYVLNPLQLRLALVRAGHYPTTILEMIKQIPDVPTREEALVWWEYATEIAWDHPMRLFLTNLIGMDEATAASLWLSAKDL